MEDETIKQLFLHIPSVGLQKETQRKHDFLITETTLLKKRRDIHILKSDKGRNIVLWKIEDYDREANRQLNDTLTYRELTLTDYNTQLSNIQIKCHEISENLLALKHISNEEDELIRNQPPTGSAIYFLPKIHKEQQNTSKTLPGRPIVATYSSVIYLLDKYITELTGHLLPLIPGSLIDTQQFIRLLPIHTLPPTTRLITADVNSLYPNIPWTEGIEAATEFYRENYITLCAICENKNKLLPPRPELFKIILTLILTNSMIHFKEQRFFRQIQGTAMGCCISVYFANCYMFSVTSHLILSPPRGLLCFLRYIDDLFFITTEQESTQFDQIISTITNGNIHYEVVPPARKQNFLDTTITLGKLNKLVTEPYSKETASGSYLHPSSNHPHHTIKATPYSQLLRIRRISSDKYIFRKHARKMAYHFSNMGYPKGLIMNCTQKILKMDETEIRAPKSDNHIIQAYKFILPFNHTYNWRKVREHLNTIHGKIIEHYERLEGKQDKLTTQHLENKSIQLIFSNEKNLSTYISNNPKKGNRNVN